MAEPTLEPMALEVDEHGGGCCGIRHVNGFWDNDSFREYLEDYTEYENDNSSIKSRDATMQDKIASIQQAIAACERDQGIMFNNRLDGEKQVAIEVVLSNYQWKFWERALQRCGFRRVHEFLNSNSGNRCRVYYMSTNQPTPGRTESVESTS